MPASKIQDEREIIRWFNEGRTYAWMSEEYRRKYHIETVPSLFSNFRRRKGLERRTVRDTDLIPWRVRLEHRYSYPVAMLRVAARDRAGAHVSEVERAKLKSWLAWMEEANAVVHYDPDTEEGWFYVPRRSGIDKDLIRMPKIIGDYRDCR